MHAYVNITDRHEPGMHLYMIWEWDWSSSDNCKRTS